MPDKPVIDTAALLAGAVVAQSEPKKRKKPSSMSPTKRSLALLRERGYRVAIVEHWNPFARIRQDLFGIVDLLAIKKGETLAVQTTTGGELSKRIRKIADSETIHDIRDAGWRFEVHGWVKRASGKWECRTEDVS